MVNSKFGRQEQAVSADSHILPDMPSWLAYHLQGKHLIG